MKTGNLMLYYIFFEPGNLQHFTYVLHRRISFLIHGGPGS